MPVTKRKHRSKLIDGEPLFEPIGNKFNLKRFYFKCETIVGECMFVYSAYNLDQAIRKLSNEVQFTSIKLVKEKLVH